MHVEVTGSLLSGIKFTTTQSLTCNLPPPPKSHIPNGDYATYFIICARFYKTGFSLRIADMITNTITVFFCGYNILLEVRWFTPSKQTAYLQYKFTESFCMAGDKALYF